MDYESFLKSKQKKVQSSGFECSNVNSILFPFQQDITKWGLKRGKCAVFADCGLGKTLIQIEWAENICQHTHGNVLILAPLGVTTQTKEEAKKLLNIDITICRSQEDIQRGINITNYEMLDKFDISTFAGVVLDESSILKNYTGQTRVKLTNAFKNTPYKMCCTATPAPNDYIELLNHAEFLDVMTAGQALSTWFINDMKTGKWRLKGHAIKEFWKWVSSWAVYIKTPSDLGYSDDGYVLPKFNEIIKEFGMDLIDINLDSGFIRNIDTSATGFYKEKRLAADKRINIIKDIVNNSTEQFIVWCYTDDESDKLTNAMDGSVQVKGSHKPSYKEEMATSFKNGDIRVLISKPSIFGYGLNFQKCHNAVFCGLTYSYEDYYQAVKRLYRYGQKSEINNYIIIADTEKNILDKVREKEKRQLEMANSISNSIKEIQLNNFKAIETKRANKSININIPSWLGGQNAI